MKDNISERTRWLVCALTAALAAAALRRWQLASAFEPPLGLSVPGAQASVILVCVLLMAAAWLAILALSGYSRAEGQGCRWDLVFLGTGDWVYPALAVLAALLALAAAPCLLWMGWGQWEAYQQAKAMLAQGIEVQLPSNNGMLAMATAAGALASFLGLLQLGRDGLRPGKRGKGGFSAALPGVAGCVWLMESFRAHAANPVLWDYAPLLLSIVCGMLFYMDCAGISAGAARPRRLLWMAGMTLILSAAALVSAVGSGWADALLLLSQMLAAAGVLWRLSPSLENPPKTKAKPRPRPFGGESTQEETTYD